MSRADLVKRYGSLGAAVDAAEAIATRLLAEHDPDEDDLVDLTWATGYIAKVRQEAHMGDCGKARWWQVAPMTCAACVYDEFMDKAWAQLENEHLDA